MSYEDIMANWHQGEITTLVAIFRIIEHTNINDAEASANALVCLKTLVELEMRKQAEIEEAWQRMKRTES